MYREDKPQEKPINELLGKVLARFADGATKQEQTEYSFYVDEARKITRSSYIVMHKRIERMFIGAPLSFVLPLLRDWVIQTQKSNANNPAALFNWYLKQYREKNQKPQ